MSLFVKVDFPLGFMPSVKLDICLVFWAEENLCVIGLLSQAEIKAAEVSRHTDFKVIWLYLFVPFNVYLSVVYLQIGGGEDFTIEFSTLSTDPLFVQ